jgi:hypothetical protein
MINYSIVEIYDKDLYLNFCLENKIRENSSTDYNYAVLPINYVNLWMKELVLEKRKIKLKKLEDV